MLQIKNAIELSGANHSLRLCLKHSLQFLISAPFPLLVQHPSFKNGYCPGTCLREQEELEERDQKAL